MSQTKNRKTIVFSKKNTDVFEILNTMQKNNENISEYICKLIRDDFNNNKQYNETNTIIEINNKIDVLKTLIEDIKNNNIIVNNINNGKDTIEVEYVTADEITELDEDDLDDILGI